MTKLGKGQIGQIVSLYSDATYEAGEDADSVRERTARKCGHVEFTKLETIK